ncbi:hypothetical protein [Vogesella oryzagri]
MVNGKVSQVKIELFVSFSCIGVLVAPASLLLAWPIRGLAAGFTILALAGVLPLFHLIVCKEVQAKAVATLFFEKITAYSLSLALAASLLNTSTIQSNFICSGAFVGIAIAAYLITMHRLRD